jgi:hypothetical protein
VNTTAPLEPTTDQCSEQAAITLDDGRPAQAFWYPSMGGYVAKAIVTTDDTGCIEVYVWHDGAFPFSDDSPIWPGEQPRSPARLHHCSGDDFIRFGQLLVEFENRHLPD